MSWECLEAVRRCLSKCSIAIHLSAASPNTTARRRAGTELTFDKTLHVWRMLPAIAAVLPGAAFVRITRDSRDRPSVRFYRRCI